MRQHAAQRQLNSIPAEHSVQPVGIGYLDCICPREEIKAFLSELGSAGFAISDYSLWQYVDSPETTVYGLGGPRCLNREGWYSEMGILRSWRDSAELESLLTTEEQRTRCALVPGFWLVVPEDWRVLP